MLKQKWKDSLILNYKALSEDGKNMSRTIALSNLSDEITDEDLFDIAKSIRGLALYSIESIHRVSDFLLLDD
ncbi:MAG: DUF1659 domain-containing protein [Oscillospiraceae bacterium]|nr:DUF1659 domain-containing protein [Oscillospiraceae bacterium]